MYRLENSLVHVIVRMDARRSANYPRLVISFVLSYRPIVARFISLIERFDPFNLGLLDDGGKNKIFFARGKSYRLITEASANPDLIVTFER